MILYLFGVPAFIGLIFWMFGLLKATAAVASTFTWILACLAIEVAIMVNQANPLFTIVAVLLGFLGPVVGLLIGVLFSKPVLFSETPAGQAKARYDALTPDERARVNGIAKKAAKVGVSRLGAWLRQKGHTSTARAINDGWKIFE